MTDIGKRAEVAPELLREAHEWNEIIDDVAGKDTLTGLFNRRGLEKAMHRLALESKRNKTTTVFIFADVDNFKEVNGKYGHPEGDKVLKKVASVLKEGIERGTDILGRWGGEEFMAYLPNTDIEGGLKLAEKLRAKAESELSKEAGLPTNITLSFGVVDRKSNDDDEETFRKVDQAMRKAKENGKNQVVRWTSDLEK